MQFSLKHNILRQRKVFIFRTPTVEKVIGTKMIAVMRDESDLKSFFKKRFHMFDVSSLENV